MANFELEEVTVEQKARIKVIGVGGAGGNAVNTMIEKGLNGIEFIVVNTDVQDLKKSRASTKIQIGSRATKGLGSGGNPLLGREAALEDQAKISEALEGADMVFITAGMGGGTGTGASPIVAQAAKELGALTVGVVTKPFTFEGPRRNKQAIEGIESLEKEVDTLIIIPNDRLASVHKISILEAFKKADEVLYQAVRGISDIIIGTGYINVDFADVKTIMSENGGKALMGTGYAEGAHRAIEAAEAAITSPLLEDISIDGARGILLNVTASPDFGIEELNEACNYIKERAHEDVNLIFGLVFDDSMKDAVRITVIATGIQGSSKVESISQINRIASKIDTGVVGDDFEIPAFIRRRSIREGK
ncbi:MAG: cell division protein FtsZ [Deltaproteobacteria bacterium]|jgi:cell division protein FtsZ|nr:Cell division protein FtsZ [bacterium HR37]GIW46633.1 MAG: cell division protein FtsZ [Deltaproteobacteria bacterium]